MTDSLFQPHNTHKSLPLALLRTREAVMARFRPMLKSHGITEQQWRVIRVLAEQDEIDVTQLAQRSFILGPSLSRILKGLETQGILKKKKARTDGRVYLARLTDKGHALIGEVQPDSERIYREIENRLGRDELLDLIEQLNSISVRLRDL